MLDWHYPASTLLRPHPSSTGPVPFLTESPLPLCQRPAPPWTSLVARLVCALRAATTTPVESLDAYHAHFSSDGGLPRYYGESTSTTTFRGLLSVHSRYGPQSPLASYEAFSESASTHLLPPESPPVLPAGARVAGSGLHRPTKSCLSKAHITTGSRTRSGPSPWAGRTGCSLAPSEPADVQLP